MGGFNKSIKALVAWRGGLFLTEGKIGVLSVSSLFLTLVGVYVGVCVCIRANTHALHRWGTRCEPRSRDETPGGPEESRWTKSWHTHNRICVQSTHVYVYYATRWDEILDYCNCFFLVHIFPPESKRCERKPPIISNLK
jgi:hypothetical protein